MKMLSMRQPLSWLTKSNVFVFHKPLGKLNSHYAKYKADSKVLQFPL